MHKFFNVKLNDHTPCFYSVPNRNEEQTMLYINSLRLFVCDGAWSVTEGRPGGPGRPELPVPRAVGKAIGGNKVRISIICDGVRGPARGANTGGGASTGREVNYI